MRVEIIFSADVMIPLSVLLISTLLVQEVRGWVPGNSGGRRVSLRTGASSTRSAQSLSESRAFSSRLPRANVDYGRGWNGGTGRPWGGVGMILEDGSAVDGELSSSRR